MPTQLLRRYTSLQATLHLLQSKSLTLLPPDSWDDKVDKALMTAYQRRKQLTSLLALCFTHTSETYHHWRIFTEGKSGVCVVFERSRLESEVQKHGVIAKAITYKKIADNRAKPVTTSGLPFTKRYAYRDEREVRFLYESTQESVGLKNVPFPPGALEEIVLNPWMPEPLVESIRKTVHLIRGLPLLEVRKSTLFDSPYWRRVTDA